MKIVTLYNEGVRSVETVAAILMNSKADVICVDDGSKDDSFELLNKFSKTNPRVLVIRHIINLGKGAAMKTGAEKAWAMGAEAVIFVDADGQHNPEHLPEFEKALESHEIVFGYRELGSDVPFVRRLGNVIVRKLVGFLFKIKRNDLLCGFMGFRRCVYIKIFWNSNRYGVETEIATIVGKKKLNFTEIKVDTIYYDRYKGVNIWDAIKIFFKIPIFYFSKSGRT